MYIIIDTHYMVSSKFYQSLKKIPRSELNGGKPAHAVQGRKHGRRLALSYHAIRAQGWGLQPPFVFHLLTTPGRWLVCTNLMFCA